MNSLAVAIEESGFATIIATTPHLYPALSALHILGIALTIGPILVVDLRYLGLLKVPSLDPVISLLQRVSMTGFRIALPTGAALFTVQAVDYVQNPAVWLKAGLLLLAGLNAALAPRLPGRDRLVGAASLLLWLGILAAGRWIAFV